MEVNLAIFIMAVGVLSMCSLFTLGYRENSQSLEDVNAAAYADACLAPLVAALSSTQLSWSNWQTIGDRPSYEGSEDADSYGIDGLWPEKGWSSYVTDKMEYDDETEINLTTFRVVQNPKTLAKNVYNNVKSRLSSTGVSMGGLVLPKGYQAGLVVTRRGAVIQLAFRLARRSQSLMSQPVFVAEVHYQGGFKENE